MKTAGHLSVARGRARSPARSWCTSQRPGETCKLTEGVPGVGSHRLLRPYGGSCPPPFPGSLLAQERGSSSSWGIGGVRLLPVHCRPVGGGPTLTLQRWDPSRAGPRPKRGTGRDAHSSRGCEALLPSIPVAPVTL